ncbi:hypothetical protein [Nocardioides sp. 1609]|uniref:hypothetical protein n=1 Tax=Nocardioides sp. 1609 TaxID=2508327 RepID=UPI00106F1EFC|nr:hypothetical protein [Nocardioides sp. 1609]
MTATPTGRRETRHGHDSVVLERTLRAPVESVWAAITESDRLARREWYLDRLAAAETGGDVAGLDLGDHHPALEEHYREMFRA